MQKRSFTRREFFGAAAAAAAALTLQESEMADPRAQKPNFLVILVDDLGFGDLSCYGAKDLHTPHIDSLVARGMRFENFYANCCVCSPTRAALLTGRFPELVGVPGVIRTRVSVE